MGNKQKTATREDIEDLASAIGELATSVDKGFRQVDGHFRQVDGHFQQVDGHFQQVEQRLDDLELGQGRIERKLDATIERIDEHSVEITKLKHKIA